ncbi:MAG: toll/interleukin-1 receptor domain-containing protein [Bellilinea sp.]
MPYRIFVSHTANDKLIAEEVTQIINNAFEGDIELYLAFQEIGGGDEWKKAIKDNLNKCDAIICLVTSEYVHKPWLFIEWSAF